MSYRDQINLQRLPRHIAIIMDGNGRWAKQQGMNRVFGHTTAVRAVRETTEACAELGVPYLTLYAFSKENWDRPKAEVNALMTLLVKTIRKETATLMKNNIRLEAIGDLSNLPSKAYKELQEAKQITAGNTRMTLILALSYGSKWEILEAVKAIATDVKKGYISPEDIDEQLFTGKLSTAAFPDPELMIRTSGEKRISNFLLWQLAYAELYFTEKHWPAFEKEDLYQAIVDYQHRERRFGKISEQITVE